MSLKEFRMASLRDKHDAEAEEAEKEAELAEKAAKKPKKSEKKVEPKLGGKAKSK